MLKSPAWPYLQIQTFQSDINLILVYKFTSAWCSTGYCAKKRQQEASTMLVNTVRSV